jgi:predicted  nucleic acid-binding Zn-ribbon protein
MGVKVSALRDLHELHQRIHRLRDQKERGPRQIEAKKRLLTDRHAALEQAKTELKSIKVKGHEKETERKAIEGRIAQLQTQINTAKSNKEYTTLVAERDAASKIKASIEDQILEFLMKEDEKNKEVHALEADVKRIEHETSELERVTTEQTADLSHKLSGCEQQLSASEAGLPSDMRDQYRRLVGRRGADALARAADGTCTGCYTGITPQMQNQLLMNEMVLCKSCGRVLYLSESAPEAGSDE